MAPDPSPFRFTVALPPMHRSSLDGRLDREVARALAWVSAGPAHVVIAAEGEGTLAHCPAWPGAEGAAALVRAGFARLVDRRNMERLNEVGRALASEQDLDALLDLILTHGRELVRAEGGSIYLAQDGPDGRELLFAHTQNARVPYSYQRFRMPVSSGSMAGFVAQTGLVLNLPDVYDLPAGAPYRFNDRFDRQAGYRTRSVLAVPLTDRAGEVLGVLQFINRIEGEGGDAEVVPFGPDQEHLALSLAGQAGVAMRNARLREAIETLFDRFVNASVLAIEQRDPVTRGHSGRVAELTVALAEAVNRTGTGRYGPLAFTGAQLRELRYASLLHDFGKVGVREEVLVKAKKLPAARLELLLQRVRQNRLEALLERLRDDWSRGRRFDPAGWRDLLAAQEAGTGALLEALVRSNEPTVLTQDVAAGLEQVEALRFTRWDGQPAPVLDPADLGFLAIRKGSLSEPERREIESHVTHTYEFLAQIPWTPDLAGIPAIAYAHHERPNGQGYPRRLGAADIPVQSRAMAIADIFDALTAQDRPYKAAVPLARSLDILRDDARGGALDPDLLDIFVQARVYERTVPGSA